MCIEEKGVEVTRELDAAVDEFWFAHNFQVGLEVTDQEPVPDDIRISLDIHFIEQLQSKQLAPLFTQEENCYVLESRVEMGSHDEIGNSQSLANEIGPVEQDAVKVLHDPLYLGLSGVDGLFIVDRSWASEGGTPPFSEIGEEFVVCEGAPLENLGMGLDILGDQGSVRVLFGDCAHKLGAVTK